MMWIRTKIALAIMLLTAATGVAVGADMQTHAVLSDGRAIELGGVEQGRTTTAGTIAATAAPDRLTPVNMLHARAGHSITTLPDGKVLIWGGIDDSGHIVKVGEWFDPESGQFTEATGVSLLPRANHTATVLTDGRLLVLGGHSDELGLLEEAELWDWRSNKSELLGVRLIPARDRHTANLLADGRVLIVGPEGKQAAIYDPEKVQFFDASREMDATRTSSASAVAVAGSSPAPNSQNVPLDTVLALRFDPPLSPESANEKTVTLIGPHGPVPARVVAAESGRLVFVTPQQELFPASHYTAFVQGVHDSAGRSLLWHALEFDTQRITPERLDPRLEYVRADEGNAANPERPIVPRVEAGSHNRKSATPAPTLAADKFRFSKPSVIDDEVWIPSEANLGGQWRMQSEVPSDIRDEINLGLSSNTQKAAWRSRRLRSIGTEVTGRILRFNDRPLSGVDVSIGDRHTFSDANGRFSISVAGEGHQELVVDGSKVGKDGDSFAQFVIGVDAKAGKEIRVKPIYLPKIRQQDWIDIPSPLTSDLTVRNPSMPGFEVHLPAGTILRGRDGKVVRRVATIPMPLDRTPINYPVNTPLHMTFQPGGMSVEGLTPGVTKGIQFLYPNYSGEAPGTRAGFINYDPTGKGWYVYGHGSVSADGASVLPDPETQIYSATGFGIVFGAPPPASSPPPCDAPQDGDPVDLHTGLFKHSTQGPAFSDVVPLSWKTTYRPGDAQKRAFGKGTSHNYGMYLYNPGADAHTDWSTFYLVLSDCAVVKFHQVSGHAAQSDYLAISSESPTSYFGSTLQVFGTSFNVRLTRRDGTQMDFDADGGNLLRIRDRFGRTLELTRSGGLISRVVTESGRYVDVLYDNQGRIKDLGDMSGRHWLYRYNAAGYLDQVTYPDATHENFTFDATGRMTDVYDRRGNRMVHNVYGDADRVIDQTLADGATYHFAYAADAQGAVTQTDVTQPNSSVRRVVFHSSGYAASDTDAVGTAQQRTTTYERDSIGFVTAVTDPLNRRTELTYDDDKHVIGVTALAGTADALSGSFAYTAAHDLHTATDPWGRTTTYTLDARRHLKNISDDFGRSIALDYDDVDRVTRITDHLNRSIGIGYDLYDVKTITDPLLRPTTRFVDTLGRLTAVEDPLHQREEIHYDINDRIKDVVDTSGAPTAFSYDEMGNLLTLTDPSNRTTSWTYDTRQRPLTRKDALGQIESWTYAPNESGATHTDRMSRTTSATFDPLGRLAVMTESDGRQLTPNYDVADRLMSLADSVGPTTTFSYNAFDQVLSENGAAGNIAYTYDAQTRLQSRTLSGQSTMTYGYDNLDRLVSLTQGSEVVGFGYDAADRRQSVTLPNGVVTTAGYDAADHLTSLEYAYGSTALGDLTYAYDAAGRLTERGGSWASTLLPTETTAAGSADANHRLVAFNGRTLSYDAVGNLADDGLNQYIYDARDQLVEIRQGATIKATFGYDVFGRRLVKNVDGASTAYRYDGANPVEEMTGGQGNPILVGLGMDERYARDDSDGRKYFLTDLLGSTAALTNVNGALTTRYQYEPYGEGTNETLLGPPSSNSYQYTGRENDGTGLYYYRARYYSPSEKRFTSEDPLGFFDGANPYAYVGGNPTTRTDPTGLYFTSVDMACMQDPALCVEILGYMADGHAAMAARMGQTCEAEYWAAVGGFVRSSEPLLIGASFAVAPIVAIERAVGKPRFPKTAEEMDKFLSLEGRRVPDTPDTLGRSKVVWQPNSHTKITLEQHPYHPNAPDWHRGPHYHVDIPGERHRRFLPGEPIPGY